MGALYDYAGTHRARALIRRAAPGYLGALNAFFSFSSFRIRHHEHQACRRFHDRDRPRDRWGGAERGAIHQAIDLSVQYGYDQVED